MVKQNDQEKNTITNGSKRSIKWLRSRMPFKIGIAINQKKDFFSSSGCQNK